MSTLDSRPTSSAEDPRYRFVYDEAVRTIEHQEQTLDDIRGRAGILLTATSVATSFLGAAALDTGRAGRWGVVAIVLFFLAGAGSVGLLWPFKGWKFRFGTRELLKHYVEAPSAADLNELFRELAMHLEDNYRENKTRIDKMWRVFQISAALLFLEVIAWLLALR